VNRPIVAIALGFALIATLGVSLAPLFLKPPVVPCTHLSAPVHFTRVASREMKFFRGTRHFPVVEYSYVVSGQRYTGTRIFCTEEGEVSLDWNKVDRFVEDARRGAGVVAWFPPDSPASACISILSEFSYSMLSNTSPQCRAG
jgi:hypothetical protein